MRVLHVNAGNETGGGKVHLLSLLSQFDKKEVELLVFEEGEISKEANELGIKTKVISQKSQIDLSVLRLFKKYISNGNFDIIHTHGPRANLFVSLIKKHINSKWLITVHSDPFLDFENSGLKGKIYTYLNMKSIHNSDKIISVSTEIKSKLISRGENTEKIAVIHNGIEFPEIILKKDINQEFTLTHIGRFHPIKRHDYLLECLKKTGIENFKLNLVGSGELLDSVKQKVNNLNIKEKVKFHGHLNRDEINHILDKSDVTILTSKSETFPLVLLESASRKTPFITTNVGDVIKMNPENKNSWIVPIDDKGALIKSIIESYDLWEKNELRMKGEKLFNYVSTKFTIQNMYKNTRSVYEQILHVQ